MNILGILKRLSIKELFLLSALMLKHPFYILPTLNATKQTLVLCDRYFKNNHHKNGKGNAFRHALWNVLICRNVFKINKNVKKSVDWAQKVTDLHEKLAPNEPLEKTMDLHNNSVGRFYFDTLKNMSLEEQLAFLKNMTENCRKITEIDEVKSYKNNLVIISEK